MSAVKDNILVQQLDCWFLPCTRAQQEANAATLPGALSSQGSQTVSFGEQWQEKRQRQAPCGVPTASPSIIQATWSCSFLLPSSLCLNLVFFSFNENGHLKKYSEGNKDMYPYIRFFDLCNTLRVQFFHRNVGFLGRGHSLS